MSRLEPKPSTMKKLFALSGNKCAFPKCNERLVDSDYNMIAQICHIEAAEPGGERFNPNQSDEERRDFSNLILLCANHHIVTNDVIVYSVDVLKKMKAEHEKLNQENGSIFTDDDLTKLIVKLLSNDKVSEIFNNSTFLINISVNFELLERIINSIYTKLNNDVNQSKKSEEKEFDRDMDLKNKINKLSLATYKNIILENIDEYTKIREFLSNPENISIKRKYLAIKRMLYPSIISAIDTGKTMDEILGQLNSKFSDHFNDKFFNEKNDKSFINCSGFFYYMYYICDLGKK